MKKFICAVAITLAFASFAPAVKASGMSSSFKVNHIYNAEALPSNASARRATYKFDLHVLANPISELSIEIPNDILFGDIEVTDLSGKKVDTTISRNGKQLTLSFTNPISPDTIVEVRMTNASSRWQNANLWQFPVFTKGMYLGLARIQTYSH